MKVVKDDIAPIAPLITTITEWSNEEFPLSPLSPKPNDEKTKIVKKKKTIVDNSLSRIRMPPINSPPSYARPRKQF
jgi:hypothetical protein